MVCNMAKYHSIKCDPKAPGVILTEPEHLQSCDANHMLKMAARGHVIRTRKPGEYGADLGFGSKTEVLLEKQRLQEKMNEIAEKHGIDKNEIQKSPTNAINTHLRKKRETQSTMTKSSPPQEAADLSQAGAKNQKQKEAQQQNDQTNKTEPQNQNQKSSEQGNT